ncbi:MAG: glycosyltransferase family 4 protein [Bacteroidales bacterium]|nr:glycosyltransferase family 4 protein [Bacteroidales bacterium]
MKILIDGTFMKPEYNRSIDVYILRLIKGFLEHGDVQITVYGDSEGIRNLECNLGRTVEKIILSEKDKSFSRSKFRRYFGQIPFIKEIVRRKFDIVLVPMISSYCCVFPRRCNEFAVIHDLFQLRKMKENLGKLRYLYEKFYFWCLCRHMKGIIAISGIVQDQVYRFCGKKASLVYNSIPFFVNRVTSLEPIIEGKYILDVNRLDPEKNPMTLLNAFSMIADRVPHKLYFKGTRKTPHYEELVAAIKEKHLENRVILDTSSLSDVQMASLYSNADLLVSPSLMEGFGYTPIEAAIYQVPVLVSDIDTLREVTRGKLDFFNPSSVEELAEKMLNKLFNPPSEEQLYEIANFFLNEYSLQRQVESMLNVFKKVL